ncbi:MAG: hypothetical protein N3A72_11070 [bacterium]|nr:hypothetical protein [bacterium]
MKPPIVNIGKRKITRTVNLPNQRLMKPQQKNVVNYSRSVYSKRFSAQEK